MNKIRLHDIVLSTTAFLGIVGVGLSYLDSIPGENPVQDELTSPIGFLKDFFYSNDNSTPLRTPIIAGTMIGAAATILTPKPVQNALSTILAGSAVLGVAETYNIISDPSFSSQDFSQLLFYSGASLATGATGIANIINSYSKNE